MITGLAHVNLTVPPSTLHQASAFYNNTLGLVQTAVPAAQQDTLAWFNIGDSGQQVHISCNSNANEPTASRHPCFRIGSVEKLVELQQRIWEHFERGGEGAPVEADRVGVSSGEFCSPFYADLWVEIWVGFRDSRLMRCR